MHYSQKLVGLGILGLVMLVVACSSTAPYTVYERDIVAGKQLFKEGDYAQARDDFLKAAQTERRPEAFALAATASYKLNDLQDSAQYIAEAERAGKSNTSYFRIAGYKSLILLSQGKKEEGMKILGDYVQTYKQAFDSDSLWRVEYMWKSGTVDLPKMEALIDRQVTEYENASDWFNKTHTGALDKGGWK